MKPREGRPQEELLRKIESLEREIKEYREFDPLTGLYNKETFYRKAEEFLAERPGREYAFVCVDIERFKLINDLYGTAEGDRLLAYLGDRIRHAEGPKAELAGRITGDVFIACAPLEGEAGRAIEENVVSWLRQYPLDMEIVPAVGIYRICDRTVPVSLMCDRAILAARSVKGNYMRHTAEYHAGLLDSIIEEQDILNAAEHALQNREFQIYVQPKCDIRSGKIVGAEALVRWIRPEKGLLPPDSFIPAFEKNGFIVKLDAYVWEGVCRLLRRWIDSGHTAVPISVNASRESLYDPGFYGLLTGLIEKYALDPRLLEIEITETAYAENLERILEVAGGLRAAGFTVLMDDFGSGYSSLNMLKDISVDILKIDLRFLQKTDGQDQRSENIIESVIRMAKWLKLSVIAEGVETAGQAAFLADAGCRYAQGYYFYRPMPSGEFEALLLQDGQTDYNGIVPPDKREISFEDLFQSGMMSKKLLNNIIGGVALYEYHDGNLAIIRVNDGYYRITGCNPEMLRVKGLHILERVPPEDRQIVQDALRRAKADPTQGVEIQFRRRRLCGDLMWMHMRLFFLLENEGRDIYYASINDITQRKEAEAQLRQSEELYRTAMLSTGRIPFMFDVEKRSVAYDETRSAIQGMDKLLEGLPESLMEAGAVAPEHMQRLHDFFYDVIEGKPNSVQEALLRLKDGSYGWRRASMTTIFDQFGRPVKAFGILEDITREHDLEERLRQGEKQLSDLKAENQMTAVSLLNEMALCGLIGGYCEENFPLYFINGEMLRLMGYGSHEDFIEHTGGFVGNTIHPDDIPHVLRELGTGYYEGQEYIVKYRTLKKDGSFFWTLDKGRVVEAEDGRLAILSVCIDLSGQQQAEENLRLANSRFRIAMQLTRADVWEYDIPTRTIVRFDPEDAWVKGAQEITGAPECLVECGWIHPESGEAVLRAVREVEEGARQSVCEMQALCKDDRYRWFRLTCTVIQQKDGKAVRMLGVSENIDHEKEKERQYKRLLRDSQRDSLTGLYTRSAFENKVRAVLEQSGPEGPVTAVALLDVDNFKQVNDAFGHVRGDEILRKIGDAIRGAFGAEAVAGRFGGDEFALLVTAAYESDVCNRLEGFLHSLNERHTDERIRISASAGVVFAAGEDFETLYRRADKALYQAKSAGKNTYAVYSGESANGHVYLNVDSTILDEMEGLIYIINQEDYGLLYCNGELRELLGIEEDEFHNRKCYQLLRGRSAPCPGCAERQLSHNSYLVREDRDETRGIGYEIREKLFYWGKHELRIELAKKKEEAEDADHGLQKP